VVLTAAATVPAAAAGVRPARESRHYAACVLATQDAIGELVAARHRLTPAGIGNEIATGELDAAGLLDGARRKVGAHFAATFTATARWLRGLAKAAKRSHGSMPTEVVHNFELTVPRVGAICPPLI
jgi:hypothetical protein